METLDTPAAVAPHIPGYVISRPLGHGSSSTVWLATRGKDGARFAVKCAKAGAAGGPAKSQADVLEGATREMRLLHGLKHKHLIHVHEILHLGGAADGTLGIVMDYAAGGSLTNLMTARGKLTIGEAVTVLTPIAQALDYLHVNGTEHGDVSPGNVLFTAVGMPLLADFGVAAKVGDKPHLGVGTPGFMEPVFESSVNGDISRDTLQPERDVYALGAVGWYCLTGTTPEQEQDRPPLSLLVPEVPKALAAALEAALSADPRKRPSARELGTAIFRSAAPEAMDLSGAVHSSVIPELLTRREILGRPPRRATRSLGRTIRWLKIRSRSLPFLRGRALPTTEPGHRKNRRQGNRLGRRLVLSAVMGALIGGASWVLWQQNSTTTAMVQQAAMESGVADPDEVTELPRGMDQADVRDLPAALAAGLRSEDPLVAVSALSAVRDIALGERRLGLLDVVNVPGSQAEATDKQVKDYLRDSASAFVGFHTALTDLTLVGPPQPDHVVVEVTATTSGYEERLVSGAVVRSGGAGTPQKLRLDLVRSDGLWRISGIFDAGPAR
ncbi:serine/threonine protein kinase [Paenarthrobacter sp. NPDC090517]|uniref:serine/threonine protein kinase n=1 Tax=Paenarthrobacter sp. NPDC090517 TaxID=3364381 RepID=UPI0037F951D5